MVMEVKSDDKVFVKATHSTLDKTQAFKYKFITTIHKNAAGLSILLQVYANLMFALFSAESPYFKYIKHIITVLSKFSREVRASMSSKTKVPTLWSILLQG